MNIAIVCPGDNELASQYLFYSHIVYGANGHIDCDNFVMSNEEHRTTPKINGLGLNRNRIRRHCDMTSLSMTTERSNSVPGYGSMVLAALTENVQANAYCNDISGLYKQWQETGTIEGAQEAGVSGDGMDINGALATSCTLAPGESKTFTFILTWYFPNVTHGVASSDGSTLWRAQGNMYTNFWSDALDVSFYVKDNFNRLLTDTHLYQLTLAKSWKLLLVQYSIIVCTVAYFVVGYTNFLQ